MFVWCNNEERQMTDVWLPGSSRIGSRRGSRGSGNGNPTSSSAISAPSAPSTTIKTLRPSSNQNDPVIEDVTIEISDRDIQSF